jgi:hypothetical protein
MPSTPSPKPAAATSSRFLLATNVLKDVGLVHVRRDGRYMLYRTNAEAIRPLHEWTATFERFWRHQLHRVKQRAEGKGSSDSERNEKEPS